MKKVLALFFLLLFLAAAFSRPLLNFVKTPLLSPVPLIQPPPASPLEQYILKALAGTKGTYAIYIKNLKTGEEYKKLERKQFTAGSLYKLWLMAAAFKQIEEGLINEDDILTRNIDYLHKKYDIDPDTAELKEGTVTLSVKNAISQMITISHNYAALLLLDKVSDSSLSATLQDLDLRSSTVGRLPKTSASDMGMLLEKIFHGEVVGTEYSLKMIEILKGQKLNDKIPKYLPSETVIAHKTGEIDYFSHDAGISFSPAGEYVIVILSQSDSPGGANERIAQISRAVYEYFNK